MNDRNHSNGRVLLVVNTRRPCQPENHHLHDEITEWIRSNSYIKVLMVNTSPFPRPSDDEVPAELTDWLDVPVSKPSPAMSGNAQTLALTVDRELTKLAVKEVDICGNAEDPVLESTVDQLRQLGRTVNELDGLIDRG